MVCSWERCESGLAGGRTNTDRNLNGHPWHLNGQPQEPKGGLLEPEVAPSGAKRHILWLRICTFAAIPEARPATPMW
jgi:hypothetical protein